MGHNDLGGQGTCLMARENALNTGSRRSSGEFRVVLGAVFKRVRETLAWDTLAVAKPASMPEAVLSAVEDGRRPLSMADFVRICGALRIAPGTMLAATLRWRELPALPRTGVPPPGRHDGVDIPLATVTAFTQELGTVLRLRRQQQTMSLRTMAVHLGLASESILPVRQAEAGLSSLTVYRLYAMCDALNLSVVQAAVTAQALVVPLGWPDDNTAVLYLPATTGMSLVDLSAPEPYVLPRIEMAPPPMPKPKPEPEPPSPFNLAAGVVLHGVRVKLGLRSADVARLGGMVRRTVEHHEHGRHRISVEQLLRWSLVLRIAPATLLAAIQAAEKGVLPAQPREPMTSHVEAPGSDLSLIPSFVEGLGRLVTTLRTQRGLAVWSTGSLLGVSSEGYYARSVEWGHVRLALDMLVAVCDKVLDEPVVAVVAAAQNLAAPLGWPNHNAAVLDLPETSDLPDMSTARIVDLLAREPTVLAGVEMPPPPMPPVEIPLRSFDVAAGDVLRRVRRSMGLVVVDVARLTLLSHRTIGDNERGRRPLSLEGLVRWSLVLRIAPATLLAAMQAEQFALAPPSRSTPQPALEHQAPVGDLSLIRPFLTELGNHVRSLRIQRNLSWRQVGRAIGAAAQIHYSESVEVTHQRLPLPILNRMCEVLEDSAVSVMATAQDLAAPLGWPNGNGHLLRTLGDAGVRSAG
jgi:transcriptional regulator with XRE-family HTH domain